MPRSASKLQKTFYSATLLLGIIAFVASRWPPPVTAAAADGSTTPLIRQDVQHDLSPKLADLVAHFVRRPGKPIRESEEEPGTRKPPSVTPASRLLHRPLHATTNANPFHIVESFDGISTSDLQTNGLLVANFATDSSGAAGREHYVQSANFAFAVYDKHGHRLQGPLDAAVLWSGFNAPCGGDWSDVVVLYDRLDDRWFISRFAQDQGNTNDWYQCFAISQTTDPMGAYYRYAFVISTTEFNDYPKFGIWPDAYFMTAQRNKIFPGLGLFVAAFERRKMLQGAPARSVLFTLDNGGFRAGMLPADWDGERRSQEDTPNYLVRPTSAALGWPADTLELWQFHVDWRTPASSTLTRTDVLSPPAYQPACGFNQNCIPQPSTTTALDPLASGYLMYRLAYREHEDHKSLLLNYTVDMGDLSPNVHAGIRWYELRKGHGPWTIYQQGDYAPDRDHRWIGSIAEDRDGKIALGYNVSGSVFPSIAFAGRHPHDPLGTLSKETLIKAGGGSQTGYIFWGDYSQLTIDPTDDCTLWYVGAYQPATTANQGWSTRIASFRSDDCDRHHR